MILPLLICAGYYYVLRTQYKTSGEPDSYEAWLLEPNDLEIVE